MASINRKSSDHHPIKSFFDNLKNIRSIFSKLDLKLFIREIPDLLIKLLYNKSDLFKLFRFDKDSIFLTSLSKLEKFSFRSLKDVMDLIILLDECYYSLYYSSQIYNTLHAYKSNSKGFNENCKIIVPKPHIYFTTQLGNEDHLKQFIKSFMNANFSTSFIEEFNLIWDLDRKQHYNPLLHLQYSRWRETICLMSILNLLCNDSLQLLQSCKAHQIVSSTSSLTMKGTDPLVPNMVRKIYDSNRIWPCYLYAFATPSIAALERLSSLSPIIEIGSGTGYWAHSIIKYNQSQHSTLRQASAVVVYAYDKNPLSSSSSPVLTKSKAAMNEYHGQSKAWYDHILLGGPDAIAKHPDATLFLCYPPPDNDMALLALRKYKGEVIAYVGEIQGDTGTKAFENELYKYFDCEEIINLPNWGDTFYSLMIWKRRKNNQSPKKYPYSCSYCKQTVTATNQLLYRCRLTYAIYFCNSKCASLGRDLHQHELTMRYLLCNKTISPLEITEEDNNLKSAKSSITVDHTSEDRIGVNNMSIDVVGVNNMIPLNHTSEDRIGVNNMSIDVVGVNNMIPLTKKQLKKKRKLEEYLKEHLKESQGNLIKLQKQEEVIDNIKLPLIELNNIWYHTVKI